MLSKGKKPSQNSRQRWGTTLSIHQSRGLHVNFHCVKNVQIRSFFWSVFSRIRTEYEPEKTLYLGTFHAVFCMDSWKIAWDSTWYVILCLQYYIPCANIMLQISRKTFTSNKRNTQFIETTLKTICCHTATLRLKGLINLFSQSPFSYIDFWKPYFLKDCHHPSQPKERGAYSDLWQSSVLISGGLGSYRKFQGDWFSVFIVKFD